MKDRQKRKKTVMGSISSLARISPSSKKRIRVLRKKTGQTQISIIENALREYERKIYLEQLNEDYARLKKNPKAWKEALKERAAWEALDDDSAEL
jgi:hypothetical protein